MFRVRINKNSISVTEKDTMTTGSVNVYPVQFEFNEDDWKGLTRIAIFKNQNKAIRYILDETNNIQMPWELMTFTGSKIFVGVCGMTKNKEIVLPSQWAICGNVVEGVIPDGDNPSNPPTDDDLNSLVIKVEDLERAVETIPVPIPEENLRDILLKGDDKNG